MEIISDCNCEKKNILFLVQTRNFFILDFIPTCLLCKTMDFSDSEEEEEGDEGDDEDEEEDEEDDMDED